MNIFWAIFMIATTYASAATSTPSWVILSDSIAKDYTLSASAFDPDMASSLGYDEFDALPSIPSESADQQQKQWLASWLERIAALKTTHAGERNVMLDLSILENEARNSLDELQIMEEEKIIPFYNVPSMVMGHMSFLIHDQSPAHRQKAAVQRFHHYVRGYASNSSLCHAAQTYVQNLMSRYGGAGFFPLRAKIEDALTKRASMMNAIRAKLEAADPKKSWQDDWTAFEKQVQAYEEFIKTELMPKARSHVPLPKRYYAVKLRQMGVDTTPERLIELAQKDFNTLLEEMKTLARDIAARHNLENSDIVTVNKYLSAQKAKTPDEALATYKMAGLKIEDLIRQHDLFTLPTAPLRMRVGTPDESRAMPIPHVLIPSFVNNTGQRPEFIVPDPSLPEVNGDNTSPAESMTLMAHEGRPGHDLQFSRIFEISPSIIRAVFAQNPTNAEGWALYAEHEMYRYFEPEARFMSLYWRLMRCARMMLDPQLQLSQVTESDVIAKLKSIGVTDEFARIEYNRYSFMWPGQATSYYFGLLKILQTKDQVQRSVGAQFKERAFHDALLDFGTVPVDWIVEDVIASLRKPSQKLPDSAPAKLEETETSVADTLAESIAL